MNTPRQLKLPFTGPPKQPPGDVVLRLARIESRLVQLMKHVGMKSDGRDPLPTDKVEPN